VRGLGFVRPLMEFLRKSAPTLLRCIFSVRRLMLLRRNIVDASSVLAT
jgi:hypothetical protein